MIVARVRSERSEPPRRTCPPIAPGGGAHDRRRARDRSQGFPPTLFVKDTDSLAEEIQRAFPDARVVKSLNTMTAALMVEPGRIGGGDHSTFVSGNDPSAKQTVVDLLTSMGHTDVIDVGDLSTARGTEMWLALWVRLMGALGTPLLNIKVVR
jgi:predicted dinucleotide-binding enzyme